MKAYCNCCFSPATRPGTQKLRWLEQQLIKIFRFEKLFSHLGVPPPSLHLPDRGSPTHTKNGTKYPSELHRTALARRADKDRLPKLLPGVSQFLDSGFFWLWHHTTCFKGTAGKQKPLPPCHVRGGASPHGGSTFRLHSQQPPQPQHLRTSSSVPSGPPPHPSPSMSTCHALRDQHLARTGHHHGFGTVLERLQLSSAPRRVVPTKRTKSQR